MLSDQDDVDAEVSVPELQELSVVGAMLLSVGRATQLVVGRAIQLVVGRATLLSVAGATLLSVGVARLASVVGATLFSMGGATLLRFTGLLKFPWLQDLQHICLYPGIEQYRLNTSILQKTERSPRQRLLEILTDGNSGFDLDSHWMMALLWSPLQGGAWQFCVVIGRGSLQFPTEPPGREQMT